MDKISTYVQNTNYHFNLIKITQDSKNNTQKIGISIYKKTLEINIINDLTIDFILNSYSDFFETKVNIGFINIENNLCFLYAKNNDIEEKCKIEGKHKLKIYKIKNLHCLVLSPNLVSENKYQLRVEYTKIKKFLINEGLLICNNPFRLDIDLRQQIESSLGIDIKFKIFENFQYNTDFSPNICKKILTPIIQGYYKSINYNILNDKGNINFIIRNKTYENGNILFEIELFELSNINNQKIFQNIFYAYFNDSKDDIFTFKKLVETWTKNLKNYFQNKVINEKNGLIINYSDKINDNKISKEIKELTIFDIINIDKEKNIEEELNNNVENFNNIGYYYNFKGINNNNQKKLLMLVSDDSRNLFIMVKIVSSIIFSIFLKDRKYKENVINNVKKEILKELNILEKLMDKYNKQNHNKIKLNHANSVNYELFKGKIINQDNINNNEDEKSKNENDKNNKGQENNSNNIEKEKIDSESKINTDQEKNLINLKDEKKINISNDQIQEQESNIIFDNIEQDKNININLEGERKISNNEEKDKEKNINDNGIDEEKNNNSNNIDQNNDIIINNIEKENNIYQIETDNNINIEEEKNNNNMEKEKIINTQDKKDESIKMFIGTYNVNALDSDLIKTENFSSFFFPKELNEYFTTNNFPIFYCIGLEEIIKLNCKNILITPKDKGEIWEKKISSELYNKYNYFLICKVQLVGILLLFYVKATEMKYLRNIETEKLKSGFMGCGNKGCCFLQFEYKKKSYGFCSCHLPAGQKKKNLINRKDTFNHILNFKFNKSEKIFQKNDFFFIFGDLNFRTNIDIISFKNSVRKELLYIEELRKSFRLDKNNKENSKNKIKVNKRINSLIFLKSIEVDALDLINIDFNSDKSLKKSKIKTKYNDDEKIENIIDEKIFSEIYFNKFWEKDELKIFEETQLAKFNIDESPITFPPTYKYRKNTNSYNIEKRVPSWTDRILYKKNDYIVPLLYDRIDINLSDHKPVIGFFQINEEN